MTDEPTLVRSSSLDLAPDCMRRWCARNLRQEIRAAGWDVRDETRGVGAAIGTAVHVSASTILGEKATGGVLPPADVATDAAMGALREETAKGVEYDRRFTPSPAIAEQQTYRMTLAYFHYVAPRVEPIMIERRLEAAIPWTRQNIVLTGQPDIVAREPNAIRDTKAGTRRGNHNAQCGAYSLLARAVEMQIDAAHIDWVPRAPMKHPQPRPEQRRLDVALAESMSINIIRQLDLALSTWREGDPERGLLPGDPSAFPANPASILCGPRYCSAHSCGKNGFCQEWRKDADG